MSDADDKPRKSLKRRQESPREWLDSQTANVIFKEIPRLPALDDEAKRPCFLVVDDDGEFLSRLRVEWERNLYTEAFRLETLDTGVADPIAWIEDHLNKGLRLDALYLDRSLATGGRSALEYLERLRKEPRTRYLPVVVMTTSSFDTDEQARRNLLKYAQWLLYRKSYNAEFLCTMATSLPSAQDAAQDRMWSDLISEAAGWIGEGRESAETRLEDGIWKTLDEFFWQRIELSLYFLHKRKERGEYVKHWSGAIKEPLEQILEHLNENDLPLLKELRESREPIKYDALSSKQLGQFQWLAGKRFLGTALRYETRPLGTLTLYRKPEQPAFRDKDVLFFAHLALQIGNFLGWRERLARHQRRQEFLAEFARLAAETRESNRQFLPHRLVEILHREIHAGDDQRSKVTARELDRASGRLWRIEHRGMAARAVKLTLDDQDSFYAQALRQRVPILRNDWSTVEGKIETTPGVCSSLTVPIASGNWVFGGVNFEHLNKGNYSEDDLAFASTLCQLCAAALMRLKQFSLHQRLAGLLGLLWNGEAFDRTVREHIYEDLQRFTGYALLYYLVSDPQKESGWRILELVDSVYDGKDDNIRILVEPVANAWRSLLETRWPRTFIRRVLSAEKPEFDYVDGEEAKRYQIEGHLEASGEKLIVYSQAVIPIQGSGASRSAMVLLFRLDQALNPEQRELLATFGQLTGEMLQHLDERRDLSRRLQLAQAEAELGFLYGQMRHVLNNQLGGIGNMLDELKDEGADKSNLNLIRRTLQRLQANLNSMRFMVGRPSFEKVDLTVAWKALETDFRADAAYPAILDFSRLERTMWNTDANILRSILYNLVLNAAQACKRSGIPCHIQLSAEVGSNGLNLRIADNGPGIPEAARARLFERGFTTRSDGAGFGLYFARLQAERIGAELSLDDVANSGAVFSLILPHRNMEQAL